MAHLHPCDGLAFNVANGNSKMARACCGSLPRAVDSVVTIRTASSASAKNTGPVALWPHHNGERYARLQGLYSHRCSLWPTSRKSHSQSFAAWLCRVGHI